MLQESTNYPTVAQRKAVAKTLGDLISHGKSRVSPNDEKFFFYIASHVLGLKEMEIIDAIKNMNNGFLNFISIGQMNKTYQIAFRNIMYQLITNERTPSYTETKDFDTILSNISNQYELPITYDTFKQSKYLNKGEMYSSPEYKFRPWSMPWDLY